MKIDINKKDILMYFYTSETEYIVKYIEIDISSPSVIMDTYDFKVPLDESLMEGMYSEDKVIKNMTFEILKNKYER